jgi:hypothetical protein
VGLANEVPGTEKQSDATKHPSRQLEQKAIHIASPDMARGEPGNVRIEFRHCTFAH